VDDADLYFQYTRSEGWSLEEGIVKTGSFSIDQGVGVRAVSGEKTAFAYSDDISEASLLDAARTVRSISSAGARRQGQGAVAQGRRPAARSTRRSTRSPRWTARPRSSCSRRSRSWPAPRTRAWRR
jgi:TldD protein